MHNSRAVYRPRLVVFIVCRPASYISCRTFYTINAVNVSDAAKRIARRWQILDEGFDSRLEPIAFFDIPRMAADSNSASSLRSLSQSLLNFQFNVI